MTTKKNVESALNGMTIYTQKNSFYFYPDDPVEDRIEKFRTLGIAQVMSDGTIEFVPLPEEIANEIINKYCLTIKKANYELL